MEIPTDQSEKQICTSGSLRTICNALDQMHIREQSIDFRPFFHTAQNDSGFGDELITVSAMETQTREETHRDSQAKTLSKEEIHILFGRDEDGDTLLHISILHGKESIIYDIIQKAPDFTYLSIPNDLYQTALHLAVLTRQNRVVRRLICAGAVIDAQDRFGNTALHLACAHGYHEIVRELLKPVEYEETRCNNYRIPYQRIPQNMDIRNFDGSTCLHLAIMNNHIEVFRLILEAEIDISFGNGKNGRTALHLASESGNVEMLSILLQKRNVFLDATDFNGLTSVQLALGRGNEEVLRLLILKGATYKTLDFEEESYIDLRSIKVIQEE